MRGATNDFRTIVVDLLISIHAPHEGSDVAAAAAGLAIIKISIHAPHEGSDGMSQGERIDGKNFNPRSP